MKSLEILDDIRLDLENYLDYLERDLQTRIKNNESEISINEVNDARAILINNMYYGYNKIKQDLEVLEIIKKIFEKANFHFYPDGYEADILLEDNDICIEAIDRITKLKVADVKKIKQWLEVNENED